MQEKLENEIHISKQFVIIKDVIVKSCSYVQSNIVNKQELISGNHKLIFHLAKYLETCKFTKYNVVLPGYSF